jgi:hypothetical protein
MATACSKNKSTPACTEETLSSFVDAVDAHKSNVRIQASNAVTQNEKNDSAEK